MREQNIFRDGFLNLLGGVDSSRSPSLISEDQAAWAGNCIFRQGFPATRPRFIQQGLVYPSTEIAEWIETHALQGSYIFSPRYQNAVIVASVGGRIFKVDPLAGFIVTEITPHVMTQTVGSFVTPVAGTDVDVTISNPAVIFPGYPIMIEGGNYMVVSVSGMSVTVTNLDAPPGPVADGATVLALDANSQDVGRAWFQQAELFLIVQDGQHRPIIYDGTKSFRSDITKQQVPTGTVMAYGKGRLWVAVNKNEFSAGNIVGGEMHEEDYARLDNVLYFTENTFLAEGGNFSVPLQSGEITGMIFMPVLDTSTGNGTLLIGTQRAVFSNNASEDRDTWKNTKSPIQTIVSIGNGPVSQYALAQTTNSDIFYRAQDGIRSFYLALRQFTNSWGSTPISTEMDQVLPYDDQLLLKYSSVIQFDNRLLFTIQPIPTPENAYHRGIGVLDFNLISNMRAKSPPAYDGIWTGFQPTLLFKGDIGGQERAFSWARNKAGLNELWEFGRTTGFDNTTSRIPSFVESRSMYGKGPTASPFTLKRVESVEIWVDQIIGTVDFTLYYRPDQYPCWVSYGTAQVCSEYKTCDADAGSTCTLPTVKRPTFKTRLNFGQPPDEDMAVDDKPSRLCYESQFRLDWLGHCRVRKFVVRFAVRDDEMFPAVS